MALKRPQGFSGALIVLEHTSNILKNNPLVSCVHVVSLMV